MFVATNRCSVACEVVKSQKVFVLYPAELERLLHLEWSNMLPEERSIHIIIRQYSLIDAGNYTYQAVQLVENSIRRSLWRNLRMIEKPSPLGHQSVPKRIAPVGRSISIDWYMLKKTAFGVKL